MPQYWDLSTAEKRAKFNEFVMGEILRGRKPIVKFEKPQRSGQQNNALWLWAEMTANFLNDAGLDQRVVLRQDAPIPWTKNAVIDQMWRPVEKAMNGSDSTRDMSKTEVSEIYEVILKHIAETQGVNLPAWPTREGA